MRYDPDRTYHIALAAVASLWLWLFAYSILAARPFISQTGNTRKLVRAETPYESYLAFAYGEHGLLMWSVTILTLALAAAWVYRAQADDWRCLHASY